MTNSRLLFPIFCILLVGHVALGQPNTLNENSTAQKHLSEAVEAAREGNREKAVSALKEFSSIKELDLADQLNLSVFNTAAHLFCAAGMDKERDEFYQRAIQDVQQITPAARKDAVLKMLASTMARCGTNGETLIAMSKSCTNPEAMARLLVLAILAESKTAPQSTWEDISNQSPQRQPEAPKPDITATTAAMKQVLDYIVSFDDVDLQSIFFDHLVQSFQNGPFNQLLLPVIESAEKLSADVKKQMMLQLKDNAAFIRQRQERLEEINNIIIEAGKIAGELDILNPRTIDSQSPEFQQARDLLKSAAQKATELDVNNGRSAVLFVIAQTQSMLGDKENAKQSLEIAVNAEKKINTNDVMLEQIASLQVNIGESDAAMQTIEGFYSLLKNQPADRVLQTLAYQLIVDGDFEKAQEVIEKITDESIRKELEAQIDTSKPQEEKTLRLWKSKDGRFSVKAAYVKSDDESVTLEKENGTTVTVDLSRLSIEDNDYIIHRQAMENAPKSD